MRDPTRTILVVADLPHPWALLRDRLHPGLVSIAWARPPAVPEAVAALDPGPWAVAGGIAELPAQAAAVLDACFCSLHWVGMPPLGLARPPRRHCSWSELAATLERALALRLGGLRLAPGRGLLLPDGSCVGRTADLESLFAAHPEGIQLAGARARSAVRRAGRAIQRHRLPLSLVNEGGRVAVIGPGNGGDAGGA